MRTTLIVGGGAAAVSALHKLIQSISYNALPDTFRIVLVEKSESIGPGLPYNPKSSDVFLLNLPYDVMSPISGEPDHFAKWLKNDANAAKWRPHFPDLDIDKNKFLPRKLFGIYLQDVANTLKLDASKQGIRVDYVCDEVVDLISTHENKLNVFFKKSPGSLVADNVLLCTGHLPPSLNNYKIDKNTKGYFETPWVADMTQIPIDQDIIVLGTHLSAIDSILARNQFIKKEIAKGYRGPIGKIHAVSRRGTLPRVIGNTAPEYDKRVLNLETLEQRTAQYTANISLNALKRLFVDEIRHAYKTLAKREIGDFDIDQLLLKPVDPIKMLEKEIKAAQENVCRPWQKVLFSVYPIVPKLWLALEDKGKKEFLEKYYSHWMGYLAAFPLHNAEIICALLKDGSVTISGGLQDVAYKEEWGVSEFIASLNDGQVIKAKYLINAAGQGHDIKNANSELIQNLLKSNMISPHPLGGIDIHFKSLKVRSRHKQPEPPLYTIGETTNGACMATADLGQIRDNQVPRAINSMLDAKDLPCTPALKNGDNQQKRLRSASVDSTPGSPKLGKWSNSGGPATPFWLLPVDQNGKMNNVSVSNSIPSGTNISTPTTT